MRDHANPLLGPQDADEWDNIIPYDRNQQGIFTARREAIKKTAQSWRVPGGISALGDRSTFMPARKKQTRRTDVTT